jgi:molybdopterin molybdotransferase
MLLSLLQDWGFEAVDLGHVADSRDALRSRLDTAAGAVDAVLTSGGVSTGDEDHVSALLRAEGRIDSWRIAIKPGRPLALGLWPAGEALLPIFGLPGNPVAAMVTALLFARPALGVMGGEAWRQPQGYMVPAAFSKNKKPGRCEFLRARMNSDGQAEVFRSEGSGRISGLSWADGLVELPDEACTISEGTLVRYIPYSSFG